MMVSQSSTQELGAFPFPAATDVTELCQSEGPCISIFLGPHRGGTGSQASGTMLKTALPEIREALAKCGVHQQDAKALLEPLEAMTESLLFNSHAETFCIYRSPRELHTFSIRADAAPGWHVDERFVVRPLVAHLDYRKSFLMLALAANRMRLLRCDDGEISPIPFPDGVPENKTEFIGSAEDGEPAKNHVATTKFGSAEARAHRPQFLGDFMKAIDRGLQPIYREHNLPLVLVGVDEETAAYAAISEYPELVTETVKMSPDGGVSGDELAKCGAEVMKRWIRPAERQALTEFEKLGMSRRSTDSTAILQAASKGQIKDLFVQCGAKLAGDTHRLAGAAADGYVYRNDDLINVAVVEVLLHKGNIWLLSPEQMPEAVPMAAVMRYANDK
jgi:hypothetical protein